MCRTSPLIDRLLTIFSIEQLWKNDFALVSACGYLLATIDYAPKYKDEASRVLKILHQVSPNRPKERYASIEEFEQAIRGEQ